MVVKLTSDPRHSDFAPVWLALLVEGNSSQMVAGPIVDFPVAAAPQELSIVRRSEFKGG